MNCKQTIKDSLYCGKYGDKNEIEKRRYELLNLMNEQTGLIAILKGKQNWINIEKELLLAYGDVPKEIDESLLNKLAEARYQVYSAKHYFMNKKQKEKNQAQLKEIERTI